MSRTIRPAEIADRLDATANYLDKHGWCRRKMYDNQGRACLLGAIMKVSPIHNGSIEYAMDKYLRSEGLTKYGMLRWNDSQRDKRKVQRHLRRFARLIRAGKYRRTGRYGWVKVS